MANRRKTYPLPDYKTVTEDIDVYIKAWRSLAAPIERELGLTLNGFDPVFNFLKGNPQTNNVTSVDLPVWFVRDLSEALVKKNNEVYANVDWNNLR
jgi:hypothetical protein